MDIQHSGSQYSMSSCTTEKLPCYPMDNSFRRLLINLLSAPGGRKKFEVILWSRSSLVSIISCSSRSSLRYEFGLNGDWACALLHKFLFRSWNIHSSQTDNLPNRWGRQRNLLRDCYRRRRIGRRSIRHGSCGRRSRKSERWGCGRGRSYIAASWGAFFWQVVPTHFINIDRRVGSTL